VRAPAGEAVELAGEIGLVGARAVVVGAARVDGMPSAIACSVRGS
jgi:hypothetical protein